MSGDLCCWMECNAWICALMRMSSGNVGSKHHLSNDGRWEEVEVEDVSALILVRGDTRGERGRSCPRILLLYWGGAQMEHKHLKP